MEGTPKSSRRQGWSSPLDEPRTAAEVSWSKDETFSVKTQPRRPRIPHGSSPVHLPRRGTRRSGARTSERLGTRRSSYSLPVTPGRATTIQEQGEVKIPSLQKLRSQAKELMSYTSASGVLIGSGFIAHGCYSEALAVFNAVLDNILVGKMEPDVNVGDIYFNLGTAAAALEKHTVWHNSLLLPVDRLTSAICLLFRTPFTTFNPQHVCMGRSVMIVMAKYWLSRT